MTTQTDIAGVDWPGMLVKVRETEGLTFQALAVKFGAQVSNIQSVVHGRLAMPHSMRVAIWHHLEMGTATELCLELLEPEAKAMVIAHRPLFGQTDGLRELSAEAAALLAAGDEFPAWGEILEDIKVTSRTDTALAKELGISRAALVAFRTKQKRLPLEGKLAAISIGGFAVSDDLLLSLMTGPAIDAIRKLDW